MGPLWIIVGGADRGGVLVRYGEDLASEKADDRLEYGALVEELALAGERLHFRTVAGCGPEEGWVSIRLTNKNLAVPMHPPEMLCPLEPAKEPVAMTFYAISDVHVENPVNFEWLRSLPRFDRATVLVAGDLAVRLAQLREALQQFQQKFDHVFYCFGNHETWIEKGEAKRLGIENSFEKLNAIRELCNELGVLTTPALIEGVWVVPVLGWYHESWDTEPPLQPPPGKKLSCEPPPPNTFASDSQLCKWMGHTNATEELARTLDRENESWGVWPLPPELQQNLQRPRGERRHPVVSFSHFLPRIELMPEKRFLFQPNLIKIVGSRFVRQRVEQLQPDLHVFGHSHFPWDMALPDGVRYRSWPLGTPAEQARRIASYPTEHTEDWHPLPVFDSLGRHHRMDEACWFSLMYSRIPREPRSCQMANYVAWTYCPEAPCVSENIISPGHSLEPACEADMLRRRKYEGNSRKSMRRQVDTWSAFDGR